MSLDNRGVTRNLLRGTNQEVWGTEVPSGVQGQNMETLENTNGAVKKIDLYGDGGACTHVSPLATPLFDNIERVGLFATFNSSFTIIVNIAGIIRLVNIRKYS